ncbi:MAG: helix-turn-helix domain-containing protein [Solirubrobacteraceae bacterium]
MSAPTKPPRKMAKADPRETAGAGEVRIELGPAQVNQILRAAGGSPSLHLSQLADGNLDRLLAETGDTKFSRSLVRGLLSYITFPDDGRYLGVAEVARHLHMNTSTTHRYITTLLAVGLVERHPRTRRYRRAPVQHLPKV